MEELAIAVEKVAEVVAEKVGEQIVTKAAEGVAEGSEQIIVKTKVELSAQSPNLDALRHRSLESMRMESFQGPHIEDGKPWFPDYPKDWPIDEGELPTIEKPKIPIIQDGIPIDFGSMDEIPISVKNITNTEGLGEQERLFLTDEEKALIKDETGWSDEIIDSIESMDQYEIYKNADLHEAEINGRKCLLKDIDLDYVDPKSGKTNRELMEMGRNPYDAKTGEKLELHHMGQAFDAPFAELCEYSEHDVHSKALHPYGNSWRRDVTKKNYYNNIERPNHWKARVKEN